MRSKDGFFLRLNSPLYRVTNPTPRERVGLLVVASLFAGFVAFFVIYYDGRDILFLPVGTSRGFLAVAGAALPIFAVGLLTIALAALRRAFRRGCCVPFLGARDPQDGGRT